MRRSPTFGRVARLAFFAAALGLGGWELADRWDQIRSGLARVGPGTAAAAFAAVLVSQVGSMMAWRALLTDHGSRIPVSAAARIFWMSGIGKYLPGSVWVYVAQVEMAQRREVPRSRTASVSIVAVLVSLVTGLLVAAVTMPWTAPAATHRYWPVFLAVPVLVLMLHPAVLRRLIALALRVLHRAPSDEHIGWRGIALSSAWSLVTWAGFGLQLWLLSSAVAGLGASKLPLCLGAFGLAWSAGFLFVIAPAGAGVREAVLVAALAPVMAASAGLAVALLSRLTVTACDLAVAGLGALLPSDQRKLGRHCGSPSESDGKEYIALPPGTRAPTPDR